MRNIKILSVMILVVLLAGCCRNPNICHPPAHGNQYSVMGFIMGGGLAGHIIRQAKVNKAQGIKVQSSYAISKQKKERERHFNTYHNELNVKR